MGNRMIARNPPPSTSPPTSLHLATQEKRKRKAEEMVGEHEVEDVSPRRKKIQCTSDYIYETLFNRGADSDITIHALGKEWKLHKLYLKQSRYFSSMFSGSWKESNMSFIALDIPDLNITVEALNVAFGSLYRDEITLQEVDICSTLAAASMLQMDGLLEHCRVYMRENLRADTVVGFITAASMYGISDIEEECRKWLLLHLLKRYTVTLLKDMRSHLLTEILTSHDLYVMQIEMDVYTLAKKWLFLTQNPEWSSDPDKLLGDAEEFFRTRESFGETKDLLSLLTFCWYHTCQQYGERSKNGSWFLDSEDGKEYVGVFRAIRLQHILNDKPSVATVEVDRIVPEKWLLNLFRKQWLKMLSVDQRLDPGPTSQTEEEFNKMSVRCGRVIHEEGEYCWRWTGFSFGFDTLVTCDTNTSIIAIKRNTNTQPCVSAVSMQPKRSVAVRLRVVSLDENETIITSHNSGLLHLNLAPDEEYALLKNVSSSHFPIYISINFSLTSADTY